MCSGNTLLCFMQ